MVPIWIAALSATALFSVTQASGASAHFCSPAADLERKVEFCSDNELFVEAAAQCLLKLSRKIDAETAALGKKLSSGGDDATLGQQSGLSQNEGDLASTIQSLSSLLKEALSARKDMSSYLDILILPGAPDRATLARFKLARFLSKARCYGRNRAELQSKSKELDRRISSLRRTLAATGSMRATDQGKLENLKAKNGPGAARLVKPSKVDASGKRAKTPVPSSTITGNTKATLIENAP